MTDKTSMDEPRETSQQPLTAPRWDAGDQALAQPAMQLWKPPTEADKMLEAGKILLAAAEKDEENLLKRMTGNPLAFVFRHPRDIFRASIASPFSFDDVPQSIGYMASRYEAASGFDRSGIIVAATVAAASVIHDDYRLVVKQETDWTESARLWAVLIGAPSTGKSPTIRAATGHIKAMHAAAVALWFRENEGVKEKDRPPMPALYTSDATVAALSEKLRGNPRGLLMLTEEFSSWIGAIDATDRGQAAQNRGHWLQLYDGGSHQIDRIGRGSFLVPNWSASVLAACTPDGLRQHMGQLPDDGLIHRFIPVVLGAPNFGASGDARDALLWWERLLSDTFNHTGNKAVIRFSPEAKQLFDTEHMNQRRLTDATNDFAPALASHLGKHGGMMARVALTFHVCTDPRLTTIDVPPVFDGRLELDYSGDFGGPPTHWRSYEEVTIH